VLIEIFTIVENVTLSVNSTFEKNKGFALSYIESNEKTMNSIHNLFYLNFELMLHDMNEIYSFLIFIKRLISKCCKYVRIDKCGFSLQQFLKLQYFLVCLVKTLLFSF